jgi:hypothetical protein
MLIVFLCAIMMMLGGTKGFSVYAGGLGIKSRATLPNNTTDFTFIRRN